MTTISIRFDDDDDDDDDGYDPSYGSPSPSAARLKVVPTFLGPSRADIGSVREFCIHPNIFPTNEDNVGVSGDVHYPVLGTSGYKPAP